MLVIVGVGGSESDVKTKEEYSMKEDTWPTSHILFREN